MSTDTTNPPASAQQPAAEGESIAAVLAEMLAWERLEFEQEGHVDTQDLLTRFCGWRPRLLAALHRTPYEGIGRAVILEALKEGASYRDSAAEDQDSGEEDGIYDEDPEITVALDAADVLLTSAIAIVEGTKPVGGHYVAQHAYTFNGSPPKWMDSAAAGTKGERFKTEAAALKWFDDPVRAHYRQKFDVRAVHRLVVDRPGKVLPRLSAEA